MFVLRDYSFLWRVVDNSMVPFLLRLSVDAQCDSSCALWSRAEGVPHREGVAIDAAILGTCHWNVDFDAPLNLAEVH